MHATVLFAVGVLACLGPVEPALVCTMTSQIFVLADVGVRANHINLLLLFLVISAHEARPWRLIHFIFRLLQLILFLMRLGRPKLGYSVCLWHLLALSWNSCSLMLRWRR